MAVKRLVLPGYGNSDERLMHDLFERAGRSSP